MNNQAMDVETVRAQAQHLAVTWELLELAGYTTKEAWCKQRGFEAPAHYLAHVQAAMFCLQEMGGGYYTEQSTAAKAMAWMLWNVYGHGAITQRLALPAPVLQTLEG